MIRKFYSSSPRIQNTLLSLQQLCIICLLLCSFAQGYPDGVGSCKNGSNSIGGTHLTRETIVPATLNDLGISVNVGGNIYENDSTIPLLPGIEYIISVNALNQITLFHGIFIRLESLNGDDITNMLLPGYLTAITDMCNNRYNTGLTHTNADMKTNVSGMLMANNTDILVMDITVVVGNEPTLSLWGYGRYYIEIADIQKS